MVTVFISHSKEDKELISVIRQNFSILSVTPLFMEFSSKSAPPYAKIEANINGSDAVFLFLTNNVKCSEYTQNWISYENGVASRAKKPFFVIEDKNHQIHFPVPYLTDYVFYEPTKREDWLKMEDILTTMKLNKEAANNDNKRLLVLGLCGAAIGGICDDKNRLRGSLVGGGVGLTIAGIVNSLNYPSQISSILIECPNCKIRFNLHSRFKEFPCPSCRR